MKLVKQIETAYGECEYVYEKTFLLYRAFVGLLIIVPLLYAAGFISGLLFFKNPHSSGIAVIDGVF